MTASSDPSAGWVAPGEEAAGWQSPGYRSARTRYRWAIGTLTVAVVILAFGVLIELRGFSIIDSAERGTLDQATANEWDSQTQGAALLYLVDFVASAIAFLAWLSRSVENVPPLGAGTLWVSPRWAIGWWFVPVANLFKPYQVVRDLLGQLRVPEHDGGSRVTLAWWICWIAGGLSTAIATRLVLVQVEPSLDNLRTGVALQVLGDSVLAISGVLAILVVREIQKRSDLRALELGLQAPAARWPAAADSQRQLSPPSGGAPASISQSVETQPAMPAATVAFCPQCGTARLGVARFCPTCGADLEAFARPS